MNKFLDEKFNKSQTFKPQDEKERLLVKAFASLKNEEEIGNFLRDLLTSKELKEFANRIEIARLLSEGKSYLKISKEVGVSTTTVTRVAYWLFSGCGGYYKVIQKLTKKIKA